MTQFLTDIAAGCGDVSLHIDRGRDGVASVDCTAATKSLFETEADKKTGRPRAAGIALLEREFR